MHTNIDTTGNNNCSGILQTLIFYQFSSLSIYPVPKFIKYGRTNFHYILCSWVHCSLPSKQKIIHFTVKIKGGSKAYQFNLITKYEDWKTRTVLNRTSYIGKKYKHLYLIRYMRETLLKCLSEHKWTTYICLDNNEYHVFLKLIITLFISMYLL